MIDVTSAEIAVAQPWMQIVAHEYMIGVDEIPGPLANERVKLYLNCCDALPPEMQASDETSWCAALAAYVYMTAGYPAVAHRAWARNWSKWGKAGPLAYGALIVVDRPSSTPGTAHVGWYLRRLSMTQAEIISGNSANTIRKSNVALSQIINGPRWPENAIV